MSQIPIFPPFPLSTKNMTTIDSAMVNVWYAFNAENIHEIDSFEDYQKLEIGSNFSRYSSYFIFYNDSLNEFNSKNNSLAQTKYFNTHRIGKNGNWSEFLYSEYIKDFERNVLNVQIRMPRNIPDMGYHENSICLYNWTLHDSIKLILGYNCQKATSVFRGRDFVAWFAIDIPINNGPLKFGGLPGLILEVYDSNKEYVFECVGIQFHTTKTPIKSYHADRFKIIDRIKLNDMIVRIHQNYFKVAGWRYTPNDGSPPLKEIIYFPFELQ
jgi:GLPGLI family protein